MLITKFTRRYVPLAVLQCLTGCHLVPCSAARGTVWLLIHQRYILFCHYPLHFYILFIYHRDCSFLSLCRNCKSFLPCLLFFCQKPVVAVFAYNQCLPLFVFWGFFHWCQVVIFSTVVTVLDKYFSHIGFWCWLPSTLRPNSNAFELLP